MTGPGSGRRDAEGQLFTELYPSLRLFAAVIAPVEIDPDDLLQEAVERALGRDRLTGFDDPEAYLRRTMLSQVSNHRRRFAIWRRSMLRLGTASATVTDVYPSDVSDLMRLPPTERAVLYLAEVEGYRHAEIGRMLGCSESAARKRAMRGRRRLYAALAGEVHGG
jgi:RNA polymerase sigma-70 factor (ECF subfamily)